LQNNAHDFDKINSVGAEIVRVMSDANETELLPISLFDRDKSFQEVIHELPDITGYTMLVPREMYGKSNGEGWKFSMVELGGKRSKRQIKPELSRYHF
jgi:hypothetical protein